MKLNAQSVQQTIINNIIAFNMFKDICVVVHQNGTVLLIQQYKKL